MAILFVKRIIPKKIPVVIPSFVTERHALQCCQRHSTRNQANIWSVLWQQYAAANQRCQAPNTTALL
jgi:hypothetical protein